MLPAVALIGRPNVGKSTLFNRLTRSRDALVADYPGVTRDRRYGYARFDERACIVIDTGGLGADGDLGALIERQADAALEQADALVLVVDHRDGVTVEDQRIAERLRRSGKPVTVAVNKAEGVERTAAEADFFAFGLGEPAPISALHGHGVAALMQRVLAPFPADEAESAEPDEAGPRLAVIGRPNVGKSTLINRLLGDERLVTSDEPGTTRDSIAVPCEREGRRFALIDTAGIRRRARISEAVEKFSVVQSLKAIEEATVAIALLDAREGVTEQDLHLIGLAIERGRALVIAINKWDGLEPGGRRRVQDEVERKLEFAGFARRHFISALHGSGIVELLRSALTAHDSAGIALSTPQLNELLRSATHAHPPPLVRGRRIRLRYAHQGGRHPPLIVIHGTQAERTPEHYRRYLENAFRRALRLEGTPVRIELKSGENPFAGRRNVLTPRQRARRRRVMRHSRK